MKGMAIILFSCVSFSCFARSDYDMTMCRNGAFPGYPGQYSVARINAPNGAKVHFYDDDSDKGCPENQALCQQKAYLINGDGVIVAQEKSGWSCVWYFGRKSEFVGWLQSTYLEKQAIETVGVNAWIGSWSDGYSKINITRGKNSTLHIKGNTTWNGGVSGYGESIVHIGSISASATPNGNTLQWGDTREEFECSGVMQLINGNLIVEDNGECGGANVSFSSIYRLKK
ncbi:hypothetical protein [Dickeya fangzhongdai]|uniref:hypothetical protein n=1 Tax=Dickeya fangzhongdai TaxID=1778540 RepID=UPI0006769A5A|nr:hypothetical protein [Dickeya fangzhongdai]